MMYATSTLTAPETSFKLDGGTLPADRAAHVLLTLLDNQIQYYDNYLFGKMVRSSTGCEETEAKLAGLRRTRDQVRKMIAEARENDLELEFDCNLAIQLKTA